MSRQKLLVNSDNLAKFVGLQNGLDNTYVNGAILTVTLKTKRGDAVTGANALAMNYVAASNGDYQVMLPYSLIITDNYYYAVVLAIGAGFRREFYADVDIEKG